MTQPEQQHAGLDPYIIDEIRRKEEEERQNRERPVVHIDPPQEQRPQKRPKSEKEGDRGVGVVIGDNPDFRIFK